MRYKLLEPYQLGPLELPNRMVVAPLTRSRARATIPGAMHPVYYAQRASAGLIITEATQAAPGGQGYIDTPGVHSEEQVVAWRRVTDAVHEAGGRIFCQLWHVGRISHPSVLGGETPVAPSAVRPNGQILTREGMQPMETPRALTIPEIHDIVEQFRRGAENARRAGFDGVEVHGANGYLLDQFLQSGTNHRADRYGGSPLARARLLLEVTEAVADVWGAERVGVRLSPGGKANDIRDADPAETFSCAARELGRLGLAYLHVVSSVPGETLQGGAGTEFNSLALLRPLWKGTLIAAAGYTRDTGEAALRNGAADLIAYGRLFIANPDLPERFAADAELNEPDRSTFYGGGATGYIDYPTLEEASVR